MSAWPRRGRRPQAPLLDRPVRSLLDLKLGTVPKGYAIYVAISLVIGLIVLLIVLATWSHGSDAGGIGAPRSISWKDRAGETVTPAQYRSIRDGAPLNAVRARFGDPATTGTNPFDMVDGDAQTCLGYRSSAAASALFLFCFNGGRLVDKQTF